MNASPKSKKSERQRIADEQAKIEAGLALELETLERLAREGDLNELRERVSSISPTSPNFPHAIKLLRQQIELRCRSNPESFAREIMNETIAFYAYLFLRVQTRSLGWFVEDEVYKGYFAAQNAPDTLADVISSELPLLSNLQETLFDLLETQAKITRAWALAKSKEQPAASPSDVLPTPPETGIAQTPASGPKRRRPISEVNFQREVSEPASAASTTVA